jgi:hypothetical protein
VLADHASPARTHAGVGPLLGAPERDGSIGKASQRAAKGMRRRDERVDGPSGLSKGERRENVVSCHAGIKTQSLPRFSPEFPRKPLPRHYPGCGVVMEAPNESEAYVQLSAAGYSGERRGVLDSPSGPKSSTKFLGPSRGGVNEGARTHYPAGGVVGPPRGVVGSGGNSRDRPA